ncbi:ABC transporter permease [Acidobacterium sp. S8]|uniref:ABC transporter permease n=1 Tax=Acidobacterium sp. S8 TaxID=1641854 RepID=UPI00131A7A42|nr:ABC transporter permease [Acidobacterium sp. S8]
MSWRRFFQRPHWDNECAQELEAHIAHEIDENLARGMDANEARRAAYLKVGNPVRVREQIWRNNSFLLLEHFLRDLRYAFRTLSRNPGYALVAILTLGLGIGANTAIFSVVNGVLLRPLPFADAGRIVHLQQKALKVSSDPFGFSVQEIRDYREQGTVFSSLAEYHSMTFTMLGTTVPERVGTGVISANFFDVLGVKPLVGRLLTAADETMTAPPVMVLSYEYWMKEFGGDKKVIGRSFELNDRMHTVVGILPPLPAYPGTDDLYMPTTSCPFRSGKDMIANRGDRMMEVYARMKPGVTSQQVADNLQTIATRLQMAYPRDYPQYSGFTAESVPIERELTHAARPTFLTLLGASGLVLLLACANLANFALSRHLGRSRETAVRLATGASRAQIFRQLLTESLLLASAGGVLGILIALAGSRLLVEYASRMTPLAGEVHLDGSVLLFAVATSLLAGVIFGVLPCLIASRIRIDSLHDSTRTTGSGGNMRTRNVLVAFQVSLSVLLLIGAGLMVRSLYNLLTVDPGFKTQNVLSMAVNLNWTKYKAQESRNEFYRQAMERVQSMPSVTDAAVSMTVPLNGDMGSMQSGIQIQGQPVHPGEPVPQADFRVVTAGYFRTLGVPVLSGRAFLDSDTNHSPAVAIVNDLMARHYWPNESPIGHHISTDEGKTWTTVVGVVSNVRQYGLDKGSVYEAYFPLEQNSLMSSHMLVRTQGNPTQLANQIVRAIHDIDPQQPVTDIKTLAQMREALLGTPRVTAMLLGGFALVALFITIVGVSGTLALFVSRSTKDIGIRMALGATREAILRHILYRGMAPVLIGLGIGVVSAFFCTRALAGMLFAVKATDPSTFAAIGCLLAVVALIACCIPGRRAARIDPMKALRMD